MHKLTDITLYRRKFMQRWQKKRTNLLLIQIKAVVLYKNRQQFAARLNISGELLSEKQKMKTDIKKIFEQNNGCW